MGSSVIITINPSFGIPVQTQTVNPKVNKCAFVFLRKLVSRFLFRWSSKSSFPTTLSIPSSTSFWGCRFKTLFWRDFGTGSSVNRWPTYCANSSWSWVCCNCASLFLLPNSLEWLLVFYVKSISRFHHFDASLSVNVISGALMCFTPISFCAHV